MQNALSPRRLRTRQRKESAIIAVAMRLVEEDGIEAVTVGRIAEAMDWSVGTMYRYFPSKDDLFGALHTRILSEYGQALTLHLANFNTDPIASIVECVRYSVQWFLGRPDQWALIGMGLAHPKTLMDDVAAQPMVIEAVHVVGIAAKPIDQAAASGLLNAGDPTIRALVLWAHVQGVLQMRKLTRFPTVGLDIDAILHAGIGAILLGWGAPQAAVDRALANQWKDR